MEAAGFLLLAGGLLIVIVAAVVAAAVSSVISAVAVLPTLRMRLRGSGGKQRGGQGHASDLGQFG